MNKNKIAKYFGLALLLSGCYACEEAFEAQPLEYWEDPRFATPVIEDEWELQLMQTLEENVYVYKDKRYDALFTRTLGWNGGDGVQTTELPDGNTFWTFNDSFYGAIDGETRNRNGEQTFPRNTIMVQTTGEDGKAGVSEENLVWLADFVNTTDPEAPKYYCARTHIRHPLAEDHGLSDEQIAAGEIDQDYLYWAGDATVCNGKLQMLWNGVDNTDPDAQMKPMNTALAIYNINGTPGDGSYLTIESVVNYKIPYNPYGYGGTLWEDEDGYTYLYGGFENYTPLVARAANNDLTSTWEYYVSDVNGNWEWTTQYPDDVIAGYSGIATNQINRPWIIKDGDWYYMIGQGIWFSKTVYIMRAKTPWGPFTDNKELFTTPSTLDKLGVTTYQHTYMINLHPSLSYGDELVFTTNTDTADFWDNFNDVGSADFYRPFFYRVYNWKSVYGFED